MNTFRNGDKVYTVGDIKRLEQQLKEANERSRKLEYLVISFRQGVTHFNRSRGNTNKLFSAYADSEQLRKEQEK